MLTSEQHLEITTRAWNDAEFAERLRQDPRAAIVEVCGVTLGDEIEIEVIVDTDKVSHTIIPHHPVDVAGLRATIKEDRTDEQKDKTVRPAELLARVQTDATLRQEFLTDPRTVLERELDTAIPSDVDVRVLEETATRIYFVLPQALVESEEVELSDAELTGVAGGSTLPCGTVSVATVVTITVSVTFSEATNCATGSSIGSINLQPRTGFGGLGFKTDGGGFGRR